MILVDLASDGPLRRDRLIQRIARAHGFQRAGREIHDRIGTAIPPETHRTKDSAGTFIWPPDHDPAVARPFKAAPGASRDPTEIPIEQLRVMVSASAKSLPDSAALLVALRDACGLQKLGSAARARFEEALSQPAAE